VAAAEKLLGISAGSTTPDGNISFITARCVGACGRAPVMMADDELVGMVGADQLLDQLGKWAIHD
jgi:bidirectional [NiFe] hydrogenase diaphorase subunit